MNNSLSKWILGSVFLTAFSCASMFAQGAGPIGSNGIQHVLLISIDGMHALDFANCAKGLGGATPGPTCPTLVQLGQSGVTYLQASCSKPSDSYPGLTAIVTGASPRTSGIFYDANYDRALSPPAKTTPYGIVGGANLCPGTRGTEIGFEEEISNDLTKLDGGGGINPDYLPRDPNNGCAPVYPHTYLRVNTIFEVIKAMVDTRRGRTSIWPMNW
jgi:Type I phosphodiesterase / nucleotide pyrophosphatase